MSSLFCGGLIFCYNNIKGVTIMSRPPIDRRIENIPDIKLFKPAGIPGRDLSEVCLTLEEVEAIRLKDLEVDGLGHLHRHRANHG